MVNIGGEGWTGNNDKIISFNDLLDNFYYKLEKITDSFSYEYYSDSYFTSRISSILKVSNFSNNIYDTTLYKNILEGDGTFNLSSCIDGGTYLLVLDKFKIKVDLKVVDKNRRDSGLCYEFYIYDEQNNLFKECYVNVGTLDLGYIYGGNYKIKLCYQGLDITPENIKNKFINFSENQTYLIILDYSLRDFNINLYYRNSNNDLLSSGCSLTVTVNKLINYENKISDMQTSYKNELDYYYMCKHIGCSIGGGNGRISNSHIGSSSIGNLFLNCYDSSSDERYSTNIIKLNELMPGLYKINIFYQSFNLLNSYWDSDHIPDSSPRRIGNTTVINNLAITEHMKYAGPLGPTYYFTDGSILNYPISFSKENELNKIYVKSYVNNLKLLGVFEQIWYENKDGKDLIFESSSEKYFYRIYSYINIFRFSSCNYSLSGNLTINKKPNTKTLYEEYSNITYENGELLNIYKESITYVVLGDLLKELYVLVNENGIYEINEEDLENYETLKDTLNGYDNQLKNIILPYVYYDHFKIDINNSGYPDWLHQREAVRLIAINTETRRRIY